MPLAPSPSSPDPVIALPQTSDRDQGGPARARLTGDGIDDDGVTDREELAMVMQYRVQDGKVVAIRDTTSPPPAPVPIEADSIATATPWQHFVDRFGIVTAVGLLAIIAASLVAYNTGVTPVADASLVQLVLMIVVLGCMTVLALRTRR